MNTLRLDQSRAGTVPAIDRSDLDLADTCTAAVMNGEAMLILLAMKGLSGSGKSTLAQAQRVRASAPAPYLISDPILRLNTNQDLALLVGRCTAWLGAPESLEAGNEG